ncbi:hypothetical protein ACVXRV_004309 [Enterobacter roggenkampii]
MITITKEFTKEQLQQIIETDHVQCGEASSLARIALASLEAEPVAYMYKDRLHTDARFSLHTRFGNWSQEDINEYEITEIPLYTAPPAPANAETVAWLWSHRKHPSEVSLVRPEDDERAEGAHWSGWSCQALYAAPPAPVSVPDDVMAAIQKVARIRLDLNDFDGDKRGILDCLSDAEEALIEVVNRRAAMLQGAEPVTTAYKLPFEQWLSRQGERIEIDCGCVSVEVFMHWLRMAYGGGNSPVIPDGWALVPVEPTEDMIVNGFESEPDESFSDAEVWEAYDAMSGCQQAAHRAKLCWSAMIAAAPKPDVR